MVKMAIMEGTPWGKGAKSRLAQNFINKTKFDSETEQRETPIIAENIIQKYIIKPLQLFWNPKIRK